MLPIESFYHIRSLSDESCYNGMFLFRHGSDHRLRSQTFVSDAYKLTSMHACFKTIFRKRLVSHSASSPKRALSPTIVVIRYRRSSVPTSRLLGLRTPYVTLLMTHRAQRSGRVQRARVRPRASMRGQGAWPAGWPAARYFHLILRPFLLAPLHAPLLSLVAPSARLSSTVARAHHHRRGTLRGGNGVTRRGIPLLSPPRDLILITILLFLSSELQLCSNCGNASRRLAGLPFIRSFFYFVCLSLSLFLRMENVQSRDR